MTRTQTKSDPSRGAGVAALERIASSTTTLARHDYILERCGGRAN